MTPNHQKLFYLGELSFNHSGLSILEYNGPFEKLSEQTKNLNLKTRHDSIQPIQE
jgi:hypothetical protein